MTHDHAHAGLRAGTRHRPRLLVAFVLVAGFLAVEAVAAVLTRSLALLSDAGHMLTDAIGLGMALAAVQLADRAAAKRAHEGRTFGLYRLEILAAFVNALLLLAVAAYVVVEAVRRLDDDPEVLALPMLVVALGGLAVNVVCALLLRPGAGESLNVEGAYTEVLADLVGSVGVIVAAVLLQLTGWTWVDPVVGVALGLFILPRAWRLGGKAVRILLQAAPPEIDTGALRAELAQLDDVVDVHDLHVWTLTSEMESASAHLMVAAGTDTHRVLDRARLLLQERYGIAHATLQIEPDDHSGCDQLEW